MNAVLIYLLTQVIGDYSFRANYWAAMGFTPSTSLFPLTLITSAVKGGTSIPGLLTLDWEQVLILAIVVADGIYIWEFLRRSKQPIRAMDSPAQ